MKAITHVIGTMFSNLLQRAADNEARATVEGDKRKRGKYLFAEAAGTVAVTLIVLYLISPMFTATHFEVLSAQVQINAIAANEHRLELANLSYPIHTEYFYLSRIGVVCLLQLFSHLVGNGDLAFKITTMLSFVIYISAAVALAHRYTRVNRLAALVALLTTPGVISIGFFFNDNVVSEGIGMLSLALLPSATDLKLKHLWIARSLVGGMCLGFAFLARSDAFVFLPILAALTWLESQRWSQFILVSLSVATGIAVVVLLCYVLSNVSLIQIFEIGRFFQVVHDEKPRGHLHMVILGLLFIGLSSLILLPVGAKLNLSGGDLKRAAVLVGLPLILFVLFAGHALETRMFFPILAPFIGMHAGRGVQWLFENCRDGTSNERVASRLVLALLVMIWVAPPIYVPVKEGPRQIFGQLWGPLVWREWQTNENANLYAAQQIVDATDGGSEVAVVTLDYTSDAFLRLRLWQSEFRPTMPGLSAPGCDTAFEVWRNGERLLVMIRTENPHQFVPEPHNYIEALEISTAFKCGALGLARKRFGFGSLFFDTDSEVQRYLRSNIPNLEPEQIWLGWPAPVSQAFARKVPSSAWMNMTVIVQHATPLSSEQLAGLLDAADLELAHQSARSDRQLRELSELRHEWGYRFWYP